MLSIPVAVHNSYFKWQLDLFWYAHRTTYGELASSKALAAIVTQNRPQDPMPVDEVNWNIDVPFVAVEPFYKAFNFDFSRVGVPLNIQAALSKILPTLPDEQVIEVLDCDMYHFRPAPSMSVPADILLASTIYEDWHLKSKSALSSVISVYFENGGSYYNGGFVPLIGRVSTFKKILREWIAVHIDILKRNYGSLTPSVHWWAGMYALQAACEKARVTMQSFDSCFVPPVNKLNNNHYAIHYSVDSLISKKSFLKGIRNNHFPDQPPYNLFTRWVVDRDINPL